MEGNQVRELRVSLVWMETSPSLVGASPPPDAPLRALGRAGSYQKEFDESRNRTGQLEPPWPKRKEGKRGEHFFWYRYLKGKAPDQVKSGTLWSDLMPLRSDCGIRVSEVRVSPGSDPGGQTATTPAVIRVRCEAFHYPHGIGLIITLGLKGSLQLRDAVHAAVQARTKQIYEIKWSDGSTSQLSLDALAEHALERLRKSTFGPQASEGVRPGTPISIATLISGSGPAADEEIAQEGEIHRALEALCGWSKSWEKDKLPSLKQRVLLSRKNAPAGHVLYGSARARAVWYSEWFTSKDKIHTLSCYHRNLTLLGLQTESLLGLVRLAATESKQGNQSATLDELVRNGVGLLGRLYGEGGQGWVDSMYQSWSARKHIDSSACLDEIDKLRTINDMGPLHRSPAPAPGA